MSAKSPDPQSLIDDYLGQVRRATATLPTGREQLLADLAAHIQTALDVEQPGERRVDAVHRVLADLGSPQQIAAAAYEQAGVPLPQRRTPSQQLYDAATIALLTIGGWMPLPVVGWLIGAGLLWRGARWGWHDKLVGTLLSPLVVPMGYGLVLRAAGPTPGFGIVTPRLLAVAAVSTLLTGIYLIVRVRRYQGVSASPASA